MSVISKDTTFLGYRRENGRVGVRNHVIVLPLDDLSNAAAEAVAHNIKGVMAIPHPYGRLQFGADLAVEPGIYIPEEALGVRIEDDVLITEEGNRVLSAKLPRLEF